MAHSLLGESFSDEPKVVVTRGNLVAENAPFVELQHKLEGSILPPKLFLRVTASLERHGRFSSNTVDPIPT